MILDDFKSVGVKVPDSYIDDEIRDRIRHRYRDRAALIKELQAQGITYEMFRQRMHDEIVENFMRQKNVSSAILISPQKIERYYDANLHQFKLGNQVKLRMIVLNRSPGGRRRALPLRTWPQFTPKARSNAKAGIWDGRKRPTSAKAWPTSPLP